MCCALVHLLISQSGKCRSISRIDPGSHALTANTSPFRKKGVSASAITFCVSLFMLQSNGNDRCKTRAKGRERLDYLWYCARKEPGVLPTVFLNNREK